MNTFELPDPPDDWYDDPFDANDNDNEDDTELERDTSGLLGPCELLDREELDAYHIAYDTLCLNYDEVFCSYVHVLRPDDPDVEEDELTRPELTAYQSALLSAYICHWLDLMGVDFEEEDGELYQALADSCVWGMSETLKHWRKIQRESDDEI